jgi:hypothetical protein
VLLLVLPRPQLLVLPSLMWFMQAQQVCVQRLTSAS